MNKKKRIGCLVCGIGLLTLPAWGAVPTGKVNNGAGFGYHEVGPDNNMTPPLPIKDTGLTGDWLLARGGSGDGGHGGGGDGVTMRT